MKTCALCGKAAKTKFCTPVCKSAYYKTEAGISEQVDKLNERIKKVEKNLSSLYSRIELKKKELEVIDLASRQREMEKNKELKDGN